MNIIKKIISFYKLNYKSFFDKNLKNGLIIIKSNDIHAIMLDIHCESNSVAKSKEFLDFSNLLGDLFLQEYSCKSSFNFSETKLLNSNISVQDLIYDFKIKTKENIRIKRYWMETCYEGEKIFTKLSKNKKIGVMIKIKNSINEKENIDKLMDLATSNIIKNKINYSFYNDKYNYTLNNDKILYLSFDRAEVGE